MLSKVRYLLVLIAAALTVFVVLLVTGPDRNANTDTIESQADPIFSVSDLNVGLQGNPEAEQPERVFFSLGTLNAAMPAKQETSVKPLSESAPTENVTGEQPEASDDTEDTFPESLEEDEGANLYEAVSEDSISENELYGLELFFRDKLVIDTSKVDLYLNVREEASEDSKILSVLYPNDIMPIVGRDGDFYEIGCEGYTGYVHENYVLTGEDAYRSLKDTVAYAVMTKQDEIYMYAEMDDSGEKILAAKKGEAFRVIGESGAYYQVSVSSPIYDALYVPKMDVVLYYLFLGPGNDNELSDETEEYLGTLNISGNLTKATKIREEAAEEQSSYEEAIRSYEESVEAERRKREAEEASRASESAAEATTPYVPEQPTETTAVWQPTEQTPAPVPETTAEPTAPAEETAPAAEPYRYIGVFRVTGYCHCQRCCGVWGSNDPNYQAHGASGMALIDNYSVAVNPAQIPFGTRLLINGKEYIACDSGVAGNCIDIYRRSHDDALSVGMYYTEVYVIE